MSITGGVAAVRQGIAGRVPDRLAQFRASGEVPALVSRVTPCAARVPVPGRALQLGILTIGDRPPPGRERFLEDLESVDFVHDALGKNVNRCAQSYVGIEGLDGADRIHLDRDDLFGSGAYVMFLRDARGAVPSH